MSGLGGSKSHSEQSSSLDAVTRMTLEAEIQSYLTLAKSALEKEEYEEAVIQYSNGVELIEQVYGPVSLENAEALLFYGRALLRNAIHKNSLLGKEDSTGDKPEKTNNQENGKEGDESKDEGEDEEEEPDMKGKLFNFAADPDQEEEEDSNAEEEENANQSQDKVGEDEDDDFALAWQALDSARAIYQEHTIMPDDGDEDDDTFPISNGPHNTPEVERVIQNRIKLGEVYNALGDLLCETEHFEKALNEYNSALSIQYICMKPHDRRIAETRFKIAVSHEYLFNRDQAREELAAVIGILDEHIESLNADKDKEEIKECEELKDEINAKINDLKEPYELPLEVLKEIYGTDEGFTGPQEDAQVINSLVKRKNQEDDDSNDGNEAEKVEVHPSKKAK